MQLGPRSGITRMNFRHYLGTVEVDMQPLTLIENYLSGMNTSESFISYWVKRIFYYDFPVEYFATLYMICLAWTVALWKLFPPRKVER